MMLAHPLLRSPIEFKENRVPVLIVENGQLFRRLIGDLLAQENGEPGEFALSENAGLTEIGKNVQMTLNPLFPELDGRRILTKIQQMAVTAAEDQPAKTAECLAALNDYGAALTAAVPFNVTFSEMESADDVVKALAFRVDTEEMSIPEQLLEMMDKRPEGTELVITGHQYGMDISALTDRADYVTKFVKEKHPFDLGMPCRKGIEE